MSTTEDRDAGSREELMSKADMDAEADENDDNSVEKLLKDLETEPDISDDDDEESVEDLLKALVQDEEEKLKKVFKKKKDSEADSEHKTEKVEDVGDIELASLADDDDGISASKFKLALNIPSTLELPIRSQVESDLSRRKRKLLRKHTSQTGKILCGIFCIIIMLAIGLGILALAYFFKIKDLYIVGGIFTGGGIVFTIGFIIVRCAFKYEPDVYTSLYKQSPNESI